MDDYAVMFSSAEGHLQGLKAEIDAFLATEPYYLVGKQNVISGDYSVHVSVVHKVPNAILLKTGGPAMQGSSPNGPAPRPSPP